MAGSATERSSSEPVAPSVMRAAKAAIITLGIQTSLRVEPLGACYIRLFAGGKSLDSSLADLIPETGACTQLWLARSEARTMALPCQVSVDDPSEQSRSNAGEKIRLILCCHYECPCGTRIKGVLTIERVELVINPDRNAAARPNSLKLLEKPRRPIQWNSL